MYGYYDGFTCAQIDLMTTDCPLILYKNDKKNGKSRGKSKNNKLPRPNPSNTKAAIERWTKKYGNEGAPCINLDIKGYSISDKK